jgi:6-phosphogluconolactonase (cycloisomerase 2 family)
LSLILVPVVLVLLFTTSCGGGSGTADAPKLQSIAVAPGQTSVAAGLTQQFTATGTYSNGISHPIAAQWATSDTSLATVDSQGLVKTFRPGTVSVTGASGGTSSTAQLTIGPPTPVLLNIVPANSSVLIASAPTKLSALLQFTDGSTQDVSATSTWNAVNPFAATVDPSGNVAPQRVGYTTIGCAHGAFSANAAFVVIAEPRYLYFMSDAGRLVSKAVIDSGSGQLRMSAYIPTGADNYSSFHCATTDPQGRFLYVGAAAGYPTLSGEIQIYSIDPVQGVLTPIPNSPFPQAAPVDCLEFEPTGKFAYAASSVNSSTGLLTYAVASGSSGALTLVNSMNLPGTPTRVAVDPLGQYLYFVAFTNGFHNASAYGYNINSSTGALTPIPGTPFDLTQDAGSFSFHPSGDYVYLANTNGASIETFSLDRSTGKLTAGSTVMSCINPSIVRFSPNGKFAYTGCSMDAAHTPNSASVDSFAVGQNGALTHLSSTPSAFPLDLTIDPSGQFLYLSEPQPYIHVFQIAADGTAKLMRRFGVPPNPGVSMVVSGGTSAVKYSPKTAYVTSTSDNQLSTYSVNSDGTLSLLQSTSTSAPYSSLSVWPWGTDIAMSSAMSAPNVLAFPLSAAGLPGASDLFGDATLAGGVAIDPSGQFAFESDSSAGVIYTYGHRGGTWGLFTYIGTGTTYNSFKAGAGAGPIAIDPSGLLVFVGNQIDKTISVYQYWGDSAQLIESTGQFVQPYTDGSPFNIGANPLALAVDPNEAFVYVLCGDSTLRVFAIDYFSGGHIAQVASVQLLGQTSGLAVEPKGQFIYTSDSSGVKTFAVNASSGALSPVALNPPITLPNIKGIYAEPAGKYLYVATGAQNVAGAVFGFSIGLQGNLTAVSAQPVASPALPSSMGFTDDIR